jgi:U3 small nucleolar RNA-associated protein 3
LTLVHEGRDKILLDGSDVTRNHSFEDYDDQEEVFALNGLDDQDSEDSGHDLETLDERDEGGGAGIASSSPPLTSQKSSKTKTSAPSKPKKDKLADSDEDEDDEDDERWGKNKSAYYSSANQEIDSDDEEARELEEAEARRLQTKSREALAEQDYGLDDILRISYPGRQPSSS